MTIFQPLESSHIKDFYTDNGSILGYPPNRIKGLVGEPVSDSNSMITLKSVEGKITTSASPNYNKRDYFVSMAAVI